MATPYSPWYPQRDDRFSPDYPDLLLRGHDGTRHRSTAPLRTRGRRVVNDAAATPKIAALIAAAAEPISQPPWVTFQSDDVVLIYGRDAQAVEAGNLLKTHLDVTVLITPPVALIPPGASEFPIATGKIRFATGYLGAFEITVDEFAPPSRTAHDNLSFGTSRDGAVSRCDIVIDLSGGPMLFPGPDLRDGYLRANPGNPAAVLSIVQKARDLVGTFDKPRYISFTENLCAYSRSLLTAFTMSLAL